MKGSRPAHVDVGLVERLKYFDEVGAFPLREQRHKTVAMSDTKASGTEVFCRTIRVVDLRQDKEAFSFLQSFIKKI